MIGTLGQFVREIRDVLAGGVPIPVSIEGTDVVINAEIDNEVEIKNDVDNPIPVSGVVNTLTGLEIPEHDYIGLSYTGDNMTGVVYKTGGASGTTVATLTIAYDGSNRPTSVTRS